MINKGGYEYDSVFVITKDEIYMYCILGMEFSLLVPNLLFISLLWPNVIRIGLLH